MAERSLYAVAYPFDPLRAQFDPEHASYFVDVVDPPATASYRRTLLAVTTLNEALHGLSSGADAATIAGQITTLSAIGAAAADVVALASAGGVTSSIASVSATSTINTVLKGLEPVTAQVIAFEKRNQFRERLLQQGETIREAILEVRKSTPDVFKKLQDKVIARANSDESRTGLTEAEPDEIQRTWTLIAHWTVLLDASLSSLVFAVNAVKADNGAGSFDGILYGSAQLAEAVRAARRTLAGRD